MQAALPVLCVFLSTAGRFMTVAESILIPTSSVSANDIR